ncbi:MAG: DUF2911 domain-containing protein [Cyclobacteriaceae bacterium]
MCSNKHRFQYSFIIAVAILGTIITGCGQTEKEKRPSPFTFDQLNLNGDSLYIGYSSPRVRERTIWGKLVPYGKMWRTGANEATVFKTSKDIILNDTLLTAGSYSVFTIPDERQWTLIFNKDWELWGSYYYNEDNDALRLPIEPNRSSEFSEEMKFELSENALNFHWENLTFSVSIDSE